MHGVVIQPLSEANPNEGCFRTCLIGVLVGWILFVFYFLVVLIDERFQPTSNQVETVKKYLHN